MNKESFTIENPQEINDYDVFKELTPYLQKWWYNEFNEYTEQNNGLFTPPQKEAIPSIEEGNNTLITAPTGSGKTLAAHASVIDRLLERAESGELENSIYCLYISPMKSLANDIHRNLETPLSDIQEMYPNIGEIRQAIRHGDTPDSERQKMLENTPHILNTTPETLAILLNSPKFRENFSTVEYIIVDEIHSLANNKRGTHLSVSLERVERISKTSPVRIGCSATVEPLEKVGRFLCGQNPDGKPRDFNIVDKRFNRNIDLKVESPVNNLITTNQSEVQKKFYQRLDELIQDSSTAIVFTNTRSGSERVLQNLRGKYPNKYTPDSSANHHGSMSKEDRQKVEKALKNGNIDVVTTSTSLELGIDMKDVDLVIQVGSPKSISGLLQRVGRAGHQLGETITGRVLVLDRDELVECTVMAKKAVEGHIDRIFIPKNAQDVAAQHVYGIAINNVIPENEVLKILRSAYPYEKYTKEDFDSLLQYLTASYDGLEDRNVYPKIWRDTNDSPSGKHHYKEYPVGQNLIGKKGKMARVIYMTNIGTIPDSFSCDVFVRETDNWVGELDEEYLNTLEKGDVFTLGGNRYEYRYRRGSKVYVDRTSNSPTVPSWFSERLPLSYDLGREILKFQSEVTRRIEKSDGEWKSVKEWLGTYPIDNKTVDAIIELYTQQREFLGENCVSTEFNLSIEHHIDESENEQHYYIRSLYGRKFNDGLARLIAQVLTEKISRNVQISVSDHGVLLTLPKNQSVDIKSILSSFNNESDVRNTLKKSLQKTDFLKRYFRINATRSLMILRRYKGNKKSAAQQQVKSDMLLSFSQELDDFAVINETYREILEDKLDVDKLSNVLKKMSNGEVEITVHSVTTPSPRAFGIALLSASDVVLAEDESKLLEQFHEQVLEEVNTDSVLVTGNMD